MKSSPGLRLLTCSSEHLAGPPLPAYCLRGRFAFPLADAQNLGSLPHLYPLGLVTDSTLNLEGAMGQLC